MAGQILGGDGDYLTPLPAVSRRGRGAAEAAARRDFTSTNTRQRPSSATMSISPSANSVATGKDCVPCAFQRADREIFAVFTGRVAGARWSCGSSRARREADAYPSLGLVLSAGCGPCRTASRRPYCTAPDVPGPARHLARTSMRCDLADGCVEQFEGRVGLVLRQHQRRREADRVAARAEHEQALVEALLDDRVALGRWRAPWSSGPSPARRRSSGPCRARRR